MKPKKKPAKPRTRRSPDDRCLEHSESRLEHALAEQLMHATALAQLEAEIPRLRAIIAALRPAPATPTMARVSEVGRWPSQKLQNVGASCVDVSDHLKRFMPQMNAGPAVIEDEGLLRPGSLPGDNGEELLP